MEQKNFINSQVIKPRIKASKKYRITRINVLLMLGAIAVVTAAIPVGIALTSNK